MTSRAVPFSVLENALFHISPEFLENSKIRTKGGTKTEEVKATKKDKAIILYRLKKKKKIPANHRGNWENKRIMEFRVLGGGRSQNKHATASNVCPVLVFTFQHNYKIHYSSNKKCEHA